MPLLLPDQRTEGWHEARKLRLTASLAAACLGLHPYDSAKKAWRTILGLEQEQDNQFMAWGREFEAQALRDYEVETGNLVDPGGFWIHEECSWLGASPDGLVGDDGLVEVKCPKVLPTAIPLHHRIQMLVQLLVTGRQWCDYYCWSHTERFTARVHRSGLPGLLRRLLHFYSEYVVFKVEPPRKAAKRKAKNE